MSVERLYRWESNHGMHTNPMDEAITLVAVKSLAFEICECTAGNRAACVSVIPGHGQLSSLDDLRAYLSMLQATRDAVALALKDVAN
jgi:hypothetical protein